MLPSRFGFVREFRCHLRVDRDQYKCESLALLPGTQGGVQGVVRFQEL